MIDDLASDADRDQALTALQEAFAAGRITKDELEERAGKVYGARTYGDIDSARARLPYRLAQMPSQARTPRTRRDARGHDGPGGGQAQRTSAPQLRADGAYFAGIGVLTCVFIYLKLTGVTSWPWLWVLAPVWAPGTLALLLIIADGFRGMIRRR